ncbi:MAG: tetratricopeptide (TPR) repeat protein [Bradymonadia bacterium]
MSRDDSKSPSVPIVLATAGAERGAAATSASAPLNAEVSLGETAPIDLSVVDSRLVALGSSREEAEESLCETHPPTARETVEPGLRATLLRGAAPALRRHNEAVDRLGPTQGNVVRDGESEDVAVRDTSTLEAGASEPIALGPSALSVSLDFSVIVDVTPSDVESVYHPQAPSRPKSAPRRSPRGGDMSDTVVAGRYELKSVLGEGGFGTVYRAHDRLSGDEVAVKLLHRQDSEETFRFRAEVSLLRLLRLPNLVHLLDDGLQDGRPFLVTELINGSPFPGVPAPVTWAEMEQPTFHLLEALARVHAYGVVHRDLKPANVLVREDGTPSLLDFGVAFGPGFSKDGDKGMVVGTPAFLAPEQALGARGDMRSDLYALGAMLYEGLTGRLPHEATTLRDLLRAKINDPVRPIRTYAPDAPPLVCAAIEATLRTRPEERPPSVAALLLMLGVKPEVEHLPRLGGLAPIEHACALLTAGHSAATTGAPGLGHSRLLRDVGEALEASGQEVWRVHGSRQRWGSVPTPLRRAVSRLTDASDYAIVQALGAARDQGVVLLVDDASRVDASTRDAIEMSKIPALWVGHDDETLDRVALLPLEADDLRPLFHGPDVLLHLREDASRIAFQRTGGAPRKLVRLLDGWVKSGLCYWEDGKLRITRESLERLETGLRVVAGLDDVEVHNVDAQLVSWVTLVGTAASREVLSSVFGEDNYVDMSQRLDALIADGQLLEDSHSGLIALDSAPLRLHARQTGRREAHAQIDDGTEPGTPGRLVQLIRARDVDRVIAEAEVVAESALHGGKLGGAFSAVREALSFVRVAGRFDAEPRLLRWLALVGLELRAERWLDVALYEVERGREHAGQNSACLAQLAELLDAARIVLYVERDAGRAMTLARSVAVFDDDVWLERTRRATVGLASQSQPPEASLIEAARDVDWATRAGNVAVLARVLGWKGLALYRCGRFVEAAEVHERAGHLLGDSGAPSLTNAASALLESGDLERSLILAKAALVDAERARDVLVSCRASWLIRSISMRSGVAVAPSTELLEAYKTCTHPDTRAKAFEVEAACAWRRGDFAQAQALADTAHLEFQRAGLLPGATLSLCLALASRVRVTGVHAGERVEIEHVVRYPRVLAQCVALMILAGAADETERAQLAQALEQEECSPPRGGRVWEVLSRDECLESLQRRYYG